MTRLDVAEFNEQGNDVKVSEEYVPTRPEIHLDWEKVDGSILRAAAWES